MAGAVLKCPRCRQDVQVPQLEVPAEGGADAPARAARAPAERKPAEARPYIPHPARHQCPNCGILLGVRATVCPRCRADIRTGGVAQTRPTYQGEASAVPLGALVAAVLAFVVIGVGTVLLLNRLSGGAGRDQPETEPVEPAGGSPRAAAPRAEGGTPGAGGQRAEGGTPGAGRQRAEAEPGRGAGAAGGGPPPAVPEGPPDDVLASLSGAERATTQKVGAYFERLADVLSHARTDDMEQMARRWADLHAFCAANGLSAEGEHCWYRAAQFRPADAETNRVLGRTAEFAGQPVTPEQQEFLSSLSGHVRILNANPDFADHRVAAGGDELVAFGWGSEVEFRPPDGPAWVRVMGSDEAAPVCAIRIDAALGVEQYVEFRPTGGAPGLPSDRVRSLYKAATERQPPAGSTVRRDADGGLVLVRSSGLTLQSDGSSPCRMWATRSADMGFVGVLSAGGAFSAEGRRVYCGTSAAPAVLSLERGGSAVLRNGTHAVVRAELCATLWRVLSAVDEGLACEWDRVRVVERIRGLEAGIARLEADGELEGLWEADGHLLRGLSALRTALAREQALRDRASRLADELDRVRALGLSDRAGNLQLNWPRFRWALAASLVGTRGHILARLAGVGGADGEAHADYWPEPVVMDQAGRQRARFRVLGLFQADAAVEEIRDGWGSAPRAARLEALGTLEALAAPAAASFLGELSGRAQDAVWVQEALVSLGCIGTTEALAYCDMPAISAETRIGAAVGKAAAGDPATLERLKAFFDGLSPAGARRFIELVCRAQTPGRLLALARLSGASFTAQDTRRLVEALGRTGGQAAAFVLAELMGPQDVVAAGALEWLSPDEAVPIARRLVDAVTRDKAGVEAAQFLGRAPSEGTIAYLTWGASERRSRRSVLALACIGTPEAMSAATASAATTDLEGLEVLADRWLGASAEEEPGGSRVLRGPASALGFLQAVLAGSKERAVRVMAASILLDAGEEVDLSVLGALAAEDRQKRAKGPEEEGRYVPEGYERPGSVNLVPEEVTLADHPEGSVLYMIESAGGPEAAAALQRLFGQYADGTLKAAAAAALARVGGEAGRAFLRNTAAARASAYADPNALVDSLEARTAALAALGLAGDVETLPHLLDILHEAPPPRESVGELSGSYQDLTAWWQMELYGATCDCLAAICQRGSPAALTGDADLEAQLLERVSRIIENPGSERGNVAALRSELQANAVRAFGRIADPSEHANQLAVSRLRQSLGGGARGGSRGHGEEAAQTERLREALLDAVFHMRCRGGGGVVAETFEAMAAAEDLKPARAELAVAMAAYPTDQYFAVLDAAAGSLGKGVVDDAVRIALASGARGTGFARSVAGVLRRGASLPVKEEVGRQPDRVATGTSPQRPSAVKDSGADLPAWLRARYARQGGGQADAGEAERSTRATAVVAGRAESPAPGGRPYSPGLLPERHDAARKQLELVQALLAESDETLASVLADVKALGSSPYAAMVLGRYAERVPGAMAEVTAELRRLLLAGLGQSGPAGAVSEETRRAAVVALRRMATEGAARALRDGLVGEPIGRARRDRQARGGEASSPVAVHIARALGSMGRKDLLVSGLTTFTNELVAGDPVGTHSAIVAGMALLPAEDEPAALLADQLSRATSHRLRTAIAAALVAVARGVSELSSGGGVQ
jgi:hypothetical protein